ncbi:MAG: hypothetical protein ACYDG4_13220 [Desulfuromonadaceae bacterium]
MNPLPCNYTADEMKHFREMQVAILSPVMFDYPRFWACAINMVGFSWHHGLRVEEIAITERTVVDWARGDLVREALKRESIYTGKPYTHFLWLDTDHLFKADLCCQLARHDVEMVSAVYYKRLKDPTPVVYVRNEKDPEGLSHFPLLEIPPRLCKVDAFGFGACLTSREAFEKVPEPWFTLDWRAGEDIAFCAKAHRYGVQAYVDGAYTVAHIGPEKVITKDDYDGWYKANENAIIQDRVEIQLGGKQP